MATKSKKSTKSSDILDKLYNRTLYVHDLLIKIRNTLDQYPLTEDDFIALRKKVKKVKLVSNNFLLAEIDEIDKWLMKCSTTKDIPVDTVIKSCDYFVMQIDELLACFNADAFK